MVFQIKGDLFCRFLLYVRRRGKLSVSRIDGPLSLFLLQTAEKMMLIWELFSAAPESQATRRWNNLISSIGVGARHSGIIDSDPANSPIFRRLFCECFRLILKIGNPLSQFFLYWENFLFLGWLSLTRRKPYLRYLTCEFLFTERPMLNTSSAVRLQYTRVELLKGV